MEFVKKTGGESANWAFICTSTLSNSRAATTTAGSSDFFWISAASFHIRPPHNNTFVVRALSHIRTDVLHVDHAATTSTVWSYLRRPFIIHYRRKRRAASSGTQFSSRWANSSWSATAGDLWFRPNCGKTRMILFYMCWLMLDLYLAICFSLLYVFILAQSRISIVGWSVNIRTNTWLIWSSLLIYQ